MLHLLFESIYSHLYVMIKVILLNRNCSILFKRQFMNHYPLTYNCVLQGF